MIHEFTRQLPQLTSKIKPNGTIVSQNSIHPFLKNKRKWSINKILLTGFAIFTVFFLYNARYGMFRVKQEVNYTVAASSLKPQDKQKS